MAGEGYPPNSNTVRDFTIGGVRPSAITIGNSQVNTVEFSNQGVVWARPLSTLSVTKDANIKNITISKTSLTGATDSVTVTNATATYSDWLNYGDNVTFTATPADNAVTRETQTVTGTRTTSEAISDSRTTSEGISDSRTTTGPISDTQTVTSGTTGYQTVTSATTGYQTVTSGTTGYQTVTSGVTDYRTETSGTYQTGSGSWSISFNANGAPYGSTSSVSGSSNTRRDGTHYSYQSRSGTRYSYQSRPGTHYSYQSRPGTHYSYQSRPGTHYSYQSRTGTRTYNQSRTGTRYYDQSRSGTRYYDQSRDVYQERNKTRAFSLDAWSGAVSGSTTSVTLTNAILDSISESVSGKYSDSYSAWSDYDYGDWQTDATRDDWGDWTTDQTRDSWGEWTTNSTSDSWNAWTETGSEDKDWGSWSEYSSEDGNWGSWSEYSSADGNWGSWSEYSSDTSWGGWSEYKAEDGNWGGWYTASYNAITLPSSGYRRPLYQFDYWSMGSTSGAAVSPGSSYSGGTTTAYAHWSEDPNFTSSSVVRIYEDTEAGGISGVYADLYRKGSGSSVSLQTFGFYSVDGTLVASWCPAKNSRSISMAPGASRTVSTWWSYGTTRANLDDLYSYTIGYVVVIGSTSVVLPVSYN